MKKSISSLLLGFLLLGSSQLFAQTRIKVEVKDATCQVALISDEEAAQGEYGWWSIWHDLRKVQRIAESPVEFNVDPGKYTLVVYWDSGDVSDGIALEKINVQANLVSMNYVFSTSDFVEWNCLSCPWLCVFDGKEYVKHSEVLKDVAGYDQKTTTVTELNSNSIIDGKIQFRIQEEKEEISFIDQIQLRVGDLVIPAQFSNQQDAAKLTASDEAYISLKKGDKIDLEFQLPESFDTDAPLQLEVTGYYNPEPEFMAEITRRLLNRN